jgi:hypothetical protein
MTKYDFVKGYKLCDTFLDKCFSLQDWKKRNQEELINAIVLAHDLNLPTSKESGITYLRWIFQDAMHIIMLQEEDIKKLVWILSIEDPPLISDLFYLIKRLF